MRGALIPLLRNATVLEYSHTKHILIRTRSKLGGARRRLNASWPFTALNTGDEIWPKRLRRRIPPDRPPRNVHRSVSLVCNHSSYRSQGRSSVVKLTEPSANRVALGTWPDWRQLTFAAPTRIDESRAEAADGARSSGLWYLLTIKLSAVRRPHPHQVYARRCAIRKRPFDRFALRRALVAQ